MDATNEAQQKLDGLTVLKDKQEIALHPEREYVAPIATPAAASSSPSRSNSDSEASGEEEAILPVASQSKTPQGNFRKTGDMDKPTVEVLSKPGGDAEHDDADLFGDFDSEQEDEVTAKRSPRAAEDETSSKKQRVG